MISYSTKIPLKPHMIYFIYTYLSKTGAGRVDHTLFSIFLHYLIYSRDSITK